ncbi:uncharacterized protein [Diabrotica undecimpunctata]|uniref:uncharacterized protein isoform X2 n=1 Tax=Diabrotica undecimpunctata TaxID=50387 RepID=UPI003B635B17
MVSVKADLKNLIKYIQKALQEDTINESSLSVGVDRLGNISPIIKPKAFITCVLKYIELVIMFGNGRDYYTQAIVTRKYFEIVKEMISTEIKEEFLQEGTQIIFDYVLEENTENWCVKKELLRFFNDVSSDCTRNVRHGIVNKLPHIYLFKLMDSITSCADYELQTVILETIFRMYSQSIIRSKLKELIPESEELTSLFSQIKAITFDEDIKKFLDTLNAKYDKVFTVLCTDIIIDNIYSNPVEKKGFDVYFNLWHKALSWYQLQQDDDGPEIWEMITLFVSNVDIAYAQNKPEEPEKLFLEIKINGPCLSSLTSYQETRNTIRYITIVTTKSEITDENLYRRILRKFFDGKYRIPTNENIKILRTDIIPAPENESIEQSSSLNQESEESLTIDILNPVASTIHDSRMSSKNISTDESKKLLTSSGSVMECISIVTTTEHHVSTDLSEHRTSPLKDLPPFRIFGGRCTDHSVVYKKLIRSQESPVEQYLSESHQTTNQNLKISFEESNNEAEDSMAIEDTDTTTSESTEQFESKKVIIDQYRISCREKAVGKPKSNKGLSSKNNRSTKTKIKQNEITKNHKPDVTSRHGIKSIEFEEMALHAKEMISGNYVTDEHNSNVVLSPTLTVLPKVSTYKINVSKSLNKADNSTSEKEFSIAPDVSEIQAQKKISKFDQKKFKTFEHQETCPTVKEDERDPTKVRVSTCIETAKNPKENELKTKVASPLKGIKIKKSKKTVRKKHLRRSDILGRESKFDHDNESQPLAGVSALSQPNSREKFIKISVFGGIHENNSQKSSVEPEEIILGNKEILSKELNSNNYLPSTSIFLPKVSTFKINDSQKSGVESEESVLGTKEIVSEELNSNYYLPSTSIVSPKVSTCKINVSESKCEANNSISGEKSISVIDVKEQTEQQKTFHPIDETESKTTKNAKEHQLIPSVLEGIEVIKKSDKPVPTKPLLCTDVLEREKKFENHKEIQPAVEDSALKELKEKKRKELKNIKEKPMKISLYSKKPKNASRKSIEFEEKILANKQSISEKTATEELNLNYFVQPTLTASPNVSMCEINVSEDLGNEYNSTYVDKSLAIRDVRETQTSENVSKFHQKELKILDQQKTFPTIDEDERDRKNVLSSKLSTCIKTTKKIKGKELKTKVASALKGIKIKKSKEPVHTKHLRRSDILGPETKFDDENEIQPFEAVSVLTQENAKEKSVKISVFHGIREYDSQKNPVESEEIVLDTKEIVSEELNSNNSLPSTSIFLPKVSTFKINGSQKSHVEFEESVLGTKEILSEELNSNYCLPSTSIVSPKVSTCKINDSENKSEANNSISEKISIIDVKEQTLEQQKTFPTSNETEIKTTKNAKEHQFIPSVQEEIEVIKKSNTPVQTKSLLCTEKLGRERKFKNQKGIQPAADVSALKEQNIKEKPLKISLYGGKHENASRKSSNECEERILVNKQIMSENTVTEELNSKYFLPHTLTASPNIPTCEINVSENLGKTQISTCAEKSLAVTDVRETQASENVSKFYQKELKILDQQKTFPIIDEDERDRKNVLSSKLSTCIKTTKKIKGKELKTKVAPAIKAIKIKSKKPVHTKHLRRSDILGPENKFDDENEIQPFEAVSALTQENATEKSVKISVFDGIHEYDSQKSPVESEEIVLGTKEIVSEELNSNYCLPSTSIVSPKVSTCKINVSENKSEANNSISKKNSIIDVKEQTLEQQKTFPTSDETEIKTTKNAKEHQFIPSVLEEIEVIKKSNTPVQTKSLLCTEKLGRERKFENQKEIQSAADVSALEEQNIKEKPVVKISLYGGKHESASRKSSIECEERILVNKQIMPENTVTEELNSKYFSPHTLTASPNVSTCEINVSENLGKTQISTCVEKSLAVTDVRETQNSKNVSKFHQKELKILDQQKTFPTIDENEGDRKKVLSSKLSTCIKTTKKVKRKESKQREKKKHTTVEEIVKPRGSSQTKRLRRTGILKQKHKLDNEEYIQPIQTVSLLKEQNTRETPVKVSIFNATEENISESNKENKKPALEAFAVSPIKMESTGFESEQQKKNKYNDLNVRNLQEKSFKPLGDVAIMLYDEWNQEVSTHISTEASVAKHTRHETSIQNDLEREKEVGNQNEKQKLIDTTSDFLETTQKNLKGTETTIPSDDEGIHDFTEGKTFKYPSSSDPSVKEQISDTEIETRKVTTVPVRSETTTTNDDKVVEESTTVETSEFNDTNLNLKSTEQLLTFAQLIVRLERFDCDVQKKKTISKAIEEVTENRKQEQAQSMSNDVNLKNVEDKSMKLLDAGANDKWNQKLSTSKVDKENTMNYTIAEAVEAVRDNLEHQKELKNEKEKLKITQKKSKETQIIMIPHHDEVIQDFILNKTMNQLSFSDPKIKEKLCDKEKSPAKLHIVQSEAKISEKINGEQMHDDKMTHDDKIMQESTVRTSEVSDIDLDLKNIEQGPSFDQLVELLDSYGYDIQKKKTVSKPIEDALKKRKESLLSRTIGLEKYGLAEDESGTQTSTVDINISSQVIHTNKDVQEKIIGDDLGQYKKSESPISKAIHITRTSNSENECEVHSELDVGSNRSRIIMKINKMIDHNEINLVEPSLQNENGDMCIRNTSLNDIEMTTMPDHSDKKLSEKGEADVFKQPQTANAVLTETDMSINDLSSKVHKLSPADKKGREEENSGKSLRNVHQVLESDSIAAYNKKVIGDEEKNKENNLPTTEHEELPVEMSYIADKNNSSIRRKRKLYDPNDLSVISFQEDEVERCGKKITTELKIEMKQGIDESNTIEKSRSILLSSARDGYEPLSCARNDQDSPSTCRKKSASLSFTKKYHDPSKHARKNLTMSYVRTKKTKKGTNSRNRSYLGAMLNLHKRNKRESSNNISEANRTMLNRTLHKIFGWPVEAESFLKKVLKKSNANSTELKREECAENKYESQNENTRSPIIVKAKGPTKRKKIPNDQIRYADLVKARDASHHKAKETFMKVLKDIQDDLNDGENLMEMLRKHKKKSTTTEKRSSKNKSITPKLKANTSQKVKRSNVSQKRRSITPNRSEEGSSNKKRKFKGTNTAGKNLGTSKKRIPKENAFSENA